MKTKIIKMLVSTILVISILSCSMLVFADNEVVIPTDDPQTIINEYDDYFWRLWIWGALKAFGINITINEVEEYTDALDEYMQSLILSYLDDIPSISNWNQWIFPWAGAINSSGFFEGNSSFVEDVNDFTEWLAEKYGIEDNEVVEIDSYKYIEIEGIKYPIYVAPRSVYNYEVDGVYTSWWPSYSTGNTVGFDVLEGKIGLELNRTYQLNSGYYFRIDTANKMAGVYEDYECTRRIAGFNWVGFPEFLNSFPYSRSDNHPSEFSSTGWYEYNGHNQIFFYEDDKRLPCSYHYNLLGTIEWKANSGTYSNDRGAALIKFSDETIENYFMVNTVGAIVTSSDIVLPNDDPSYTPGDSIVIIDGSPNYTIINFPDSVEVNNLPAVIMPSQFTDPQIEEVYRPIRSFVSLAKDGMESVIGLVNEFPEHVIVCVYAVIGGLIIFGIIKLFREH